MTNGEKYSGNKSNRWAPWLIFGLLVLANIIILLRLETFPFVDLPNHLAEAKIYSILNTDTQSRDHQFQEQYVCSVDPTRSTILHLMFCSASGHIEAGNRLYYLLYIILLPLSVWLLIRRIGGDPWFSVLSIALLYNFNVMWGFSGFTMGIPLCMLAVLAAQIHLQNPSPLRAAALAVGGLLLYYSHALVFLFFLPVYLMALLCGGRRTLKQYLLYILPMIPAVVIFIMWRWSASEFKGYESLYSYLIRYYQNDFWPDFVGQRLTGFLWNDFSWIAWHNAGKLIALLLPAAVLLPLVFSFTAGRATNRIHSVPRRQLLLFCLYAIACFLMLPQGFPEQRFLFHRFSVFVYIGLIAGASLLPPGWTRKAARLFAVGCAVLFTGLWIHYVSGFQAWSSGFAEVMRGLDGRKTLSAIIDNSIYRGMPLLIHYNNYHIVWNEGVAVSKFTDYRFKLVQTQRNAPRRLPHYDEFIREKTDIPALARSYTLTDLLLTRGSRPFQAAQSIGSWTPIRSSGEWTVFENNTQSAVQE